MAGLTRGELVLVALGWPVQEGVQSLGGLVDLLGVLRGLDALLAKLSGPHPADLGPLAGRHQLLVRVGMPGRRERRGRWLGATRTGIGLGLGR